MESENRQEYLLHSEDSPKKEENKKNNELNACDVQVTFNDKPAPLNKRTKFWKKRWRMCFPMGMLDEFKQLMRLAIPVAISSLFTCTFGPVSIAFCGHLGKTELAAAGLAMSVFNVAGIFVMTGLLTVCDTIFSQIYGSNVWIKMSSQLQKSFLLSTLCCLPCAAVFICTEPLLLLLSQNPLISSLTTEFLLLLIPALVFSTWAQVLTKYVQCQNHVYIPLFLIILTNGVNAILHYVFLYPLDLGLSGSAMAQSASYLFQVLCFAIYIASSKNVIKPCMDRSSEFIHDWGGWFRIAIPGLIMISLEWILFEIGGFVAGTLGERELAVQTVLISLDTISYNLLPYGFGTATAFRVGHHLGAQEYRGPRTCLSVALLVVWLISPFYYGTTLALRWYIPLIFSNNPDVISMVADLLPLTAAFQLLDAANGVCSGVLRGAGLQKIGALVNFGSLYVVGITIGMCLVYVANMSLKGIWLGLITGTSIQVVIQLAVCYRLNWKKQLEMVSKRIHKPVSEVIEGPSTPNHAMLPTRPGQMSIEDTSTISDKKRVTWKLVIKRLGLVAILISLLAVSIFCRAFINLSDYFGPYCIFDNGTFITVDSYFHAINCTTFKP